MAEKPKQRSHWLLLIVLALAQFMIVLDVSIVNVALPAIQRAFNMSQANLQWIVTAYTLIFGGFLLLGGRAADLFGRRRMFLIGTMLFGIASLLDGLSQSGSMLIILRGLQGLAAAMMSPAALSIVLVTYREGHERNVALSAWGAVASGGAAAGVLFGGIITQYLGWRWNFFVNVPVAIGVIWAAWNLVPAHDSEETHNDLDLPGAISITSALILLVYGLVEAPSHGWTSGSSLTYFGLSILLMAFFIANESSTRNPLIPLNIFKIRNVTAANLVQMPIVAGMFSTFFFITLYAQEVLHYSPVKTGLSFLAIPITIAITATNVPRVVQRIGFKPVLVVGPLFVAAALFWFAHVPVNGTYLHNLLPGFVLMGFGMGMNFIAVTIAATSGVEARKSGLASGILNTSQQVGGALGLAVLTGIATSASLNYVHNLSTKADKLTPLYAQVHGFHAAFYVGVGFMLAASLIALVLLKNQKPDAQELAPAAGH